MGIYRDLLGTPQTLMETYYACVHTSIIFEYIYIYDYSMQQEVAVQTPLYLASKQKESTCEAPLDFRLIGIGNPFGFLCKFLGWSPRNMHKKSKGFPREPSGLPVDLLCKSLGDP